MSEFVGERRKIEPSESLKAEFQATIEACLGHEPLNPKIVVNAGEFGHFVQIETESIGENPGQRGVIYTEYCLGPDGSITKLVDSEPLGVRLAREIKANTVNPTPSPRQLEVEELCRDFGLTADEAEEVAREAFLATPRGEKAILGLFKHISIIEQQEQLGLNDVDAFGLAEIVTMIQRNYPIL